MTRRAREAVAAVGVIEAPLAVRVWTPGPARDEGAVNSRAKMAGVKGRPAGRPYLASKHMLALDVLPGADGHAAVGAWYTWRRSGRTWTVAEAGIIICDTLSAEEREVVAAYVAARWFDNEAGVALKVLGRREFLNGPFKHWAWREGALIAAHGLPRTLGALASEWGAIRRGSYAGGFSLIVFEHQRPDGTWAEDGYRPRVRVKQVDGGRALVGFAQPRCTEAFERAAAWFRGRWLDTRTCGFALSGRSMDVAGACAVFGAPAPVDVPHDGVITGETLDVLRARVRAVGALVRVELAVASEMAPGADPTRLLSPASLGKTWLAAVGVRPRLDMQPDFPGEALGYAMGAFQGGRAELRLRGVAVPVACYDFSSGYPTCAVLTGVWCHVVAERVEMVEDTEAVRASIESVGLDDLLAGPELWRQMYTVCLVEPDGDLLPVRVEVEEGQEPVSTLAPITAGAPAWWPLADVIAAKMLGGKVPNIVRALRFEPRGVQRGLHAARIAGKRLDPRKGDFFLHLMRARREANAPTRLRRGGSRR